jgi:hypothetical protein
LAPDPQLKLEAIEKLIAFIENPKTLEAEREEAISQLNLSGTSSTDIEELSYNYWRNYFANNMNEILSERLVIISHLLPDSTLNECFQDTFQEYQDRKKQLGLHHLQR